METKRCLRIKKVWRGPQASRQLVHTTKCQFAAKGVLKVTERAQGSNVSCNEKELLLNAKEGEFHQEYLVSSHEKISDQCGKKKRKQNVTQEKQREFDDKARIEHNRMLIRRQKELAARRNHLRRQHQLKSGALTKWQQNNKLARSDRLAYRLAARKSFLTLQIKLKKVHQELLSSLKRYLINVERSKEFAKSHEQEQCVGEVPRCHDTDRESSGGEGSMEIQPCLDNTQTEQDCDMKDLIAALEKFIQLPLSPYLLLVSPTIVYDIIRIFSSVSMDHVQDIQNKVMNRMRSMFLLYDHDDFISVFVEKVVQHKRIHYDRLLQLGFIYETEAQTDSNELPVMSETDSSSAVIPENTSSLCGKSLNHLLECSKEEQFDALNMNSADQSDVDSNCEDWTVPDVSCDKNTSCLQSAIQVVPSSTSANLVNSEGKLSVRKQNCWLVNSSNSEEIITGLKAAEE